MSRPNLDPNQAGIKLKIPYPAEPRVPYTRVSPTEFLRRQAPQKLLIRLLAVFVVDLFKSPRRLEAENLFLRHQLNIELRHRSTRLPLRGSDRALLVWMTRL